jgi:NAD(P)-dependent dehydrogenase (short-subunit alcohol dehydrogenase family)
VSQLLQGENAIVTGGGTGIGAAIASHLASLGAAVAISGRRAALLEEQVGRIVAAGGRALAVAGDSATERGVEELFARAERAFGPVSILVNNAAIAGPVAPVWEQDVAGWEETVRVNLTGPWLCARAAARQMIPERRGKIVTIGSISGKRPLAARTPYCATKLALVGLTRTLALELGPYDVNVNLISPGAVNTPRLAELAEKYGVPLEDVIRASAEKRCLNRIPSTESIAQVVEFLVSERGRDVTGIDITVDAGGWFD